MTTAITPTAPLPAPAVEAVAVDQLTASFARWASNSYRTDGTITGDRLLRVLRLLGRPIYRLTELHHEAEQAAKLARCTSTDGWQKYRDASRDVERAVNAAYSAIMRDVDIVFTALTGVAADTVEALDLEIPLAQLAVDARTLLAVTA